MLRKSYLNLWKVERHFGSFGGRVKFYKALQTIFNAISQEKTDIQSREFKGKLTLKA